MDDDERAVRAAAERQVAAFGTGRLDDHFACYADDASFIFHATPQRLESMGDYRRLWDSPERRPLARCARTPVA